MKPEQRALWERIAAFELDDPDSSLMFSDRLARENGWTKEFALRAVFEYKRFMFMLCTTDHPLTPSDEVDQVWHLHLLYTWSYWKEFCPEVLGREVHHGPTKGGQDESQKYTNWYERTLAFYAETFQEPPPKDLWPTSAIRFATNDLTRIDRSAYFMVRKPFHSRP